MGVAALTVFAALVFGAAGEGDRKPHIVVILQDDLGHHDTGIYGNEQAESYTGNITALARSGIVLGNHHVHWHCSPTRRSFLTGRLPLHHSERLSSLDSDDIDLRWSWLTDKLKQAGYVSHWYGKGHTGYKSMNHLPSRHGFNGGVVFFLAGSGSYIDMPHWGGEMPLPANSTYSTDLFGSLAVRAVREHDPTVPFFLYLPFQSVHTPYDLPPDTAGCMSRIACMLRDTDRWIGELVLALKDKGMYEKTLIVYSADNGGVTDGNNFPLRGEKHTNWQGAFQAAAFVGGGFLPESLRGKTNNGLFHVVDWYPTLCHLAGVDGSDDPAVPPLPVDPSKPDQDIYQGRLSFPPVDGRDIWQELTFTENVSKRASLWLSAEVLRRGRYKLVVAKPDPQLVGDKWVKDEHDGWRAANGSWVEARPSERRCLDRHRFRPCLFDLSADPREQHDLSASMRGLVREMWAELNESNLGRYESRSPERLLGACSAECAGRRWAKFAPGPGPICGVPGCGATQSQSELVV